MTTGCKNGWQCPLTGSQVEFDARAALLGLTEASVSLEVLSAEAARVALWAQCRPSRHVSIREAAITTRDVLSLARALILPVRSGDGANATIEEVEAQGDDDSPAATITPNRKLLDLLADQGDAQPLAEGRWIPGPLRLIPIIEGQFTLLVGCQPTHELPFDIRRALELFGTFRRITNTHVGLDTPSLATLLHVPLQSLSQWLGPTPPTRDALLEWMRTRELAPLVDGALSVAEAYVPFIDKPQGLRWIPSRNVTRDGRYLLRQRTSWGSPRFTVGEIHRGELITQSSVLPGEHIRRLQYALDWQSRTPTEAQWSPQRGTLILQSELPTRERKLLSMLGTLDTNAEHYYPRRWIHLPQASSGTIEQMLADLGITLIRF